MRTNRSVSGIAYHRPEVFEARVNELRENDRIPPIYWIAHKGEGGDKDHIHFVFIGGFKTVDTSIMPGLFGVDVRPDGTMGSVLKTMPVVKSMNDWLLYAIHDADYLTSKDEVKEVSYSWADVKCVEKDKPDLERAIIDAKGFKGSKDKTIEKIKMLADRGLSYPDILLSGYVPLASARFVELIYNLYMQRKARKDKS